MTDQARRMMRYVTLGICALTILVSGATLAVVLQTRTLVRQAEQDMSRLRELRAAAGTTTPDVPPLQGWLLLVQFVALPYDNPQMHSTEYWPWRVAMSSLADEATCEAAKMRREADDVATYDSATGTIRRMQYHCLATTPALAPPPAQTPVP